MPPGRQQITTRAGTRPASTCTARHRRGSRRLTRGYTLRTGWSPRTARDAHVEISFSELKYLFECPYQFKLRFLYGFNPPIHEALGFEKGFMTPGGDAQARDPWRCAGHLRGEGVGGPASPYAIRLPSLERAAPCCCGEDVAAVFPASWEDLTRTIHSEKKIQVQVAPGVTVNGRIDLVKRIETGRHRSSTSSPASGCRLRK